MILTKKTLIFFYVVFKLISFTKSYILLNFKLYINEEQSSESFSPEKFIIYNQISEYRGNILIGTPPQKVEIRYNSQKYGMRMLEEESSNITDYFIKKLSSSLQRTDIYDSNYRPKKRIILNDTISFESYDYNNKKYSNIFVNNYPFIYLNDDEKNFNLNDDTKCYISIGMKIYCYWDNELCESIPHFLYHVKKTNSNSFIIKYNYNNYDMSFIIGEEPHIYNSSFYSINDLIYSNALVSMLEIRWVLEFKFYYFNESYNIDKNVDLNEISIKDDEKKALIVDKTRVEFLFDLDVIISERQFFFSINKTYFSKYKDQCIITSTQKKYMVISCDKNFNINTFPTLYFFNREYNYTFQLSANDLFITKGDKKYFLIIYDSTNSSPWIMGRVFLQKYLLLFDDVNKRIGFYRQIKKSNKSSNFVIIFLIVLVLLIIVGVGGFLLGKKFFGQIKKKRANELDDDYEYNINNVENDKKEILNNNE